MAYSGEIQIRNGYEYTFDGSEWVATHREVFLQSDRPSDKCYWCSKPLTKSYGPKDQRLAVDHLDNNPLNNVADNLVASCRDCNLFRGKLDRWVSGMSPAQFQHLFETMRQNYWKEFGPGHQRLMRFVKFQAEICKASADLLAEDHGQFVRRVIDELGGPDEFPSAASAVFAEALFDERDIFGPANSENLDKLSNGEFRRQLVDFASGQLLRSQRRRPRGRRRIQKAKF